MILVDNYEVEVVCPECGRIFGLPEGYEDGKLILCPQGHPVDPENDRIHWPANADGVDVPLPDFDGR
ncbi:MAG: hypothetical protein IRY92_09720 [Dactylosporangium sp.]|nr:hypothetical protein [Dactylosporangium sp.]